MTERIPGLVPPTPVKIQETAQTLAESKAACPKATNEDLRRALAVRLYVQLCEARCFCWASRSVGFDYEVRGLADQSQEQYRTLGDFLTSCIRDVDADGRPDIDVKRLLTQGKRILRDGLPEERLVRVIEGPAPSLDAIEELAPNQGFLKSLFGVKKTPDEMAGMLAPTLATTVQSTIARTAREAAGKTDVIKEEDHYEIRRPPKLKLADGRIVPFSDSVPPGAEVVCDARMTIQLNERNGYVLYVEYLDPTGKLVGTKFTGALRPSDPNVTSARATEIVESLFAGLDAETVNGDKLLSSLAAHVRAQKQLKARAQAPKDKAEAIVWRAARVTTREAQEQAQEVRNALGVAPLHWYGWLDDVREIPLVDLIQKTALPAHGIKPDFLYTVAIGEGLIFYLDAYTEFSGIALDQPMPGFDCLGVDTFGSRVKQLKARGFLPQSFNEGTDYTIQTNTNEKGETVQSGNFPNTEKGLIALAAILADERARFVRDVREVIGPDAAANLTEEQLNFFTYYYFNAGSGNGRRRLEETHDLSLFSPWKGEPPAREVVGTDSSGQPIKTVVTNYNARYNSLQRVASLRLMRELGIFR